MKIEEISMYFQKGYEVVEVVTEGNMHVIHMFQGEGLKAQIAALQMMLDTLREEMKRDK